MNVDWFIVIIVLAALYVGGSQLISFFRSMRSGVTYIGYGEDYRVTRAEAPGAFARNAWSKLIVAIFMAIAVIVIVARRLYLG
ncbi:MAG TPA: hypothetical protein VHL34_01995 [Rhizomicrobium sp.]|jgi:hypothetical protein|nr:hypothetical protein [Rhizomicrobium sp.]